MYRLLPLLGVLLFLPNSAVAASGDEAAVAALDTQYQKAVLENDADTMAKILADNFVLVSGRGTSYTKADLLKEARAKSATYEHNEDTQQKVRVYGDTAIVTALLWESGSEGKTKFDSHLWFSDVYVRTPSGWRYVFGQASIALPKQ